MNDSRFKLSRRLSDVLRDLRDLKRIQGSKGNWDSSDYMTGLYNGLELAIATAEDRVPIFRHTS